MTYLFISFAVVMVTTAIFKPEPELNSVVVEHKEPIKQNNNHGLTYSLNNPEAKKTSCVLVEFSNSKNMYRICKRGNNVSN